MMRKCLLGTLVLGAGVIAAVSWHGDSTTAQQPPVLAKANAQPDSIPGSNGKSLKPAGSLPVTQVVLFNSGVGYFQRSGEVDGDARVDLQFPASDINDLIKSLVLEDSKGKVLPLHYDSQEPIEKTLKSFAIDLSTNPSFGQILNQARGEKVEITLQANATGLPGTLTGTIIGMESAHRLASPTATVATDMEFVNLLCAEGLRTVPVTQVQRLRFLNPTIERELQRALEVVAVAHDSQKKSVRLQFKGNGKRDVSVGYVVENPIWKTSYRLVMGKDGKPRLLGWANVENTSDEDWHNVKLTLVSSRPISFQMDLYPPLYIPRPVVEPALFASLRPPTYQGPLASNSILNPGFGLQGGGFNFGGGGGGFNFGGGNNNFQQLPPNANPMNPGQGQQGLFQGGMGANNLGVGGGFAGFNGMGQFGNLGNQFGGQGGNRFNRADNNLALQNNSKITYQELQDRRNNDKTQKGEQQQKDQQLAKQLGSILTGVDPDLIEAALTAEELGNPARYVIEEKVSLPRQQSAMIPVLDIPIEATRVSIYNERVHPANPLNGMKIKNTTKQALMQGPISVFEEGQYAGDARVLDLQPGEERFISYGIDKGIEVKPFDKVIPGPEMTVRVEGGSFRPVAPNPPGGQAQTINQAPWAPNSPDNNIAQPRFEGGQLKVQYKLRQTRTYLIKNRSPEARKVVLEQAVRDGWTLAEARKLTQPNAPKAKENGNGANDQEPAKEQWLAGQNEKPMERTRDLYRFAVDVKPGELVKYEVSEELPRIDPFENTRQTDWSGFATTLGLDVWTENKRTPEGTFGLQIVRDFLQVTHNDRRTTTYFLRNRADVDRTIWLEHIVPTPRKLVGDTKPDADNAHRYRFKIPLAKGATVTHTVTEEWDTPRPESFALRTVEGTPPPRPGTNDLPQQRFVTELGFEVWTAKQTHPEALTSAKFIKGELHTGVKEEETMTYHIRNRSEENRKFTLDHVVRQNWAFAGKEKPVEGAGIRHRFTLDVTKGQTAKQEVVEERTVSKKETFETITDERLKVLTTSKVPSVRVKDSLKKGVELRTALEQTQTTLKELRAELKEINEEQARIRTNMDKLPQTSELYKRFTEKFDKAETALERVQAQITAKVTQEKQQKKDYDGFIEKLDVE